MSNHPPKEAESKNEQEAPEKESLSDAELDQVAGGAVSNVLKSQQDAAKSAISNVR